MFRRQTILTALAIATLLGPANWVAAQNEPGDRQSQDGGDRFAPGDRPDRGQGRRGRRGRGPNMDAFYDRVTQELSLDEDQVAQLNEIRAAQRERMDAFRQRWQAIRQAEQDGNQDLANQLREEMRTDFEQNAGRRRGGPMGETIEAIDGILTDQQREQFATLRDTMRTEREQQMQQRFEERYDRIAEDLQLDDDQRAVLDDIKAGQLEQMQQFRKRWDAVRQAYDDGNDTLGDQLREELVSEMRNSGGPRQFMNQVWDDLDPVLTDEQRTRAQELREERGRRWRDRTQQREQAPGEDGASAGGDAAVQGEAAGNGARGGSQDELAGALGLSGEQQAAYSALKASHTQETAAINARITVLQKQIADAEDSGDDDTVNRLTIELNQQEEALAQHDDAYYQQLGNLLTPGQQQALAEYRADQQVDSELKDIPADLRTVLRAAMKLKLDRSQKERVREMIKEARNEMKKARTTDRKNRDRDRTAEKELANRYKTRIRNLLTTEQSVKFTENLERMTPKRDREKVRRRGI